MNLLYLICVVTETILYYQSSLWAMVFRYLKWSFFDCDDKSFCHSIKALCISFRSLLMSSLFSSNKSWRICVFGPRTAFSNSVTICLSWVPFLFGHPVSGPWACSVLLRVRSEWNFSLPTGFSNFLVLNVAWVSWGSLQYTGTIWRLMKDLINLWSVKTSPHSSSNLDTMDVLPVGDDTIYQMPLLGTREHPCRLVFVFQSEGCFGNGKVIFSPYCKSWQFLFTFPSPCGSNTPFKL